MVGVQGPCHMEGRQLLGQFGFGGATSIIQRTAWRDSRCSAGREIEVERTR